MPIPTFAEAQSHGSCRASAQGNALLRGFGSPAMHVVIAVDGMTESSVPVCGTAGGMSCPKLILRKESGT